MGLIDNLLISIIHLVFVTTDILIIMILIKSIYRLWQFHWLKPINNTIESVLHPITNYLGTYVTKITGKVYSEKMLLILLLIGMTVLRFIVCSMV